MTPIGNEARSAETSDALNGLAFRPTTGEAWAAQHVFSAQGRTNPRLVRFVPGSPNTLTEVDIQPPDVSSTNFSNVGDLAFSSDGNRVYALAEGGGNAAYLLRYDIQNATALAALSLGTAHSSFRDLLVMAEGGVDHVFAAVGSRVIRVNDTFDTNNPAQPTQATLADNVGGLARNGAGTEIYVLSTGSSRVSVQTIDPTSGTPTPSLIPHLFSASPSGCPTGNVHGSP